MPKIILGVWKMVSLFCFLFPFFQQKRVFLLFIMLKVPKLSFHMSQNLQIFEQKWQFYPNAVKSQNKHPIGNCLMSHSSNFKLSSVNSGKISTCNEKKIV